MPRGPKMNTSRRKQTITNHTLCSSWHGNQDRVLEFLQGLRSFSMKEEDLHGASPNFESLAIGWSPPMLLNSSFGNWCIYSFSPRGINPCIWELSTNISNKVTRTCIERGSLLSRPPYKRPECIHVTLVPNSIRIPLVTGLVDKQQDQVDICQQSQQ